jgi:ABC-type spermidine/putrescine transport system permease subunit II
MTTQWGISFRKIVKQFDKYWLEIEYVWPLVISYNSLQLPVVAMNCGVSPETQFSNCLNRAAMNCGVSCTTQFTATAGVELQ